MINNVHINLTQEKKGYSKYGNCTQLSHIKTCIYASQHQELTENIIMIIINWEQGQCVAYL